MTIYPFYLKILFYDDSDESNNFKWFVSSWLLLLQKEKIGQ